MALSVHVESVEDRMGVREAARLYNIAYEITKTERESHLTLLCGAAAPSVFFRFFSANSN